jgi:hypothetical protein
MLLVSAPVWAQIHLPIWRPAAGPYSATNNLSVANVFSEYFDAPTASSGWTISSDLQGPAINWYTAAQSPGFHYMDWGHGMAWKSWPIGSSAFDLKFDHVYLSGLLKQLAYQSNIPQTYGGYVAVSSDPPGAQNQNTISIVVAMTQAGPVFSVRRGILYYLQSTVTATQSNSSGVTYAVNNGDRIPSSAAGTYVFVNGLGPYQIQSVNNANSFVLAPGAPTSVNHVTMGADVELSNLSGPGGGQTIQWPVGAQLNTNPVFTFEVNRNQNALTFSIFCPTFQTGTQPWGLTPGQSNLINGNTFTLTGLAASANFQYLIVSNLNNDHLTNGNLGWTGGPTSSNPPAPGPIWQGVVSNIRAYGLVTSGTLPTVSSVMPSTTSTLRGGTVTTISGSGFQSGATVRIGIGSGVQIVTPTFVSSNTLQLTLPSLGDGNFAFKYIAPSGVEAPLNGGLSLSAPTVTRIDPHEASPGGGEVVTFTGSGFDSSTQVTICGLAAPVTLIDSFHLQVTTPPCAVGFPAITVTGTVGTLFSSGSSSPKVTFGYSNHPYMNFNQSGLAALNAKWNNPAFADYRMHLMRNVAMSASLSGVTGTFQVGDTVTQSGGVTGIAYGYQYSMLVIFPTSGTFGPGPLTGPNGSANITLTFSINSMLSSLVTPLTGVSGTFNVGDAVTQGLEKGQVYSWDGKNLGLLQGYGSVFAANQPISGPSGSGTPSKIVLNSPNDMGNDVLSGWNTNTWEDYGWYDLLSGTTTYANQFWNGTPDISGSNGILSELSRIDFTDHYNQSFDIERAGQVAMFYDAMWPTLSQSQKTLFLNYLDRMRGYCNTLQANFDTFIVPSSSYFNNWISIGNSGCIQVHLSMMNSFFSALHGGTPDITKHVSNLRNTTTGYISREMAADGVILEGSLYSSFGLTSYIWAGHSCQNATGSDNCGAGGTGLLNMPNFLLNYTQTNVLFSGDAQWFTFCDTQPSLFGEAVLVDEGDRFNQPQLLYVADDFAHRIATTNGFTGALNSQPTGWDIAVPAFIWRSANPGSFSGWPTTAYGSVSNFAVIRSDGTSYAPNLVIGFKGQSADGAINGHRHFDPGSFVVQDRGQPLLIDPGYYQPNAPQHSTPVVDGTSASTGNASYLASIDPGAVVDTPVKRSLTMNITATYPSGVSRARRTLTMYQDKAFVMVDDIVPTGPGATVSNFQTGFPTTVSAGKFTVKGATASMTCTPYGPSVTASVAGPYAWGSSWVFSNLGVQWYSVSMNYTSTASNPMVLVCIDSSVGLTASVTNNGAGAIAVTFSDSTTLNYALTQQGWALQ